uniref:Uncharacterized protein n=1 Tax=Ciona savignyi TaxID=51511 RepID=H2Z658_CIOSA
MSESKGIPIRHIRLNHLSELPNDYGTTPGGTLYSTTPGGTRIIYDRSFLLKCRSSPMANTPPSNLPDIPGVTSPDKSPNRQITKIVEEKEVTNGKDKPKENGGILPNWSMHGPHVPAFHPCPANGPLQQYRQRSLQQQRQAMLDKALDPNLVYTISGPVGQNVNPMVPPDYISYPPPPRSPQAQFYDSNNNLQNNAGDGLWQMNGMPMLPQSNKPYPMSQLTSWRRMKVNQAITHAFTQSNQPFPNASQSQGAAVNFANQFSSCSCRNLHNKVTLYVPLTAICPAIATNRRWWMKIQTLSHTHKDEEQFDMEI